MTLPLSTCDYYTHRSQLDNISEGGGVTELYLTDEMSVSSILKITCSDSGVFLTTCSDSKLAISMFNSIFMCLDINFGAF